MSFAVELVGFRNEKFSEIAFSSFFDDKPLCAVHGAEPAGLLIRKLLQVPSLRNV